MRDEIDLYDGCLEDFVKFLESRRKMNIKQVSKIIVDDLDRLTLKEKEFWNTKFRDNKKENIASMHIKGRFSYGISEWENIKKCKNE